MFLNELFHISKDRPRFYSELQQVLLPFGLVRSVVEKEGSLSLPAAFPLLLSSAAGTCIEMYSADFCFVLTFFLGLLYCSFNFIPHCIYGKLLHASELLPELHLHCMQ